MCCFLSRDPLMERRTSVCRIPTGLQTLPDTAVILLLGMRDKISSCHWLHLLPRRGLGYKVPFYLRLNNVGVPKVFDKTSYHMLDSICTYQLMHMFPLSAITPSLNDGMFWAASWVVPKELVEVTGQSWWSCRKAASRGCVK